GNRIAGNRIAGVVGGVIYAFCPYHLWKAWAWIPLSNIQWLPLYLSALLALRRSRQPRHALLAGLWFGLNFLTSYIYGFMLGLVTAFYALFSAVYAFVTQGQITLRRRDLLLGALVVVVGAVLVLPVGGPIILDSLTIAPEDAPHKYVWPFEHLYGLVARPSDYLIPSTISWLYPWFSGLDAPDTTRGEFTHGLFIGYGALASMVIAAWGQWRRRTAPPDGAPDGFAMAFFWVLFVAALASSLMPPTLQLNLPGFGPLTIKGPGYFSYNLTPWFREYARFGALVMVAAAVLAGCGVSFMLQTLAARPWGRNLFLGLLALALLADYGFTRPETGELIDTAYVPEVYTWLAGQPGDLIIAEYPFPRSSQVSPNYLFYTTVHGKRLVNGHGFSTRSDLLMPALWDLTDRQTPGVLSALGVDYVLLHNRWPGFQQWYAALPTPFVSAADLAIVQRFDTAMALQVKSEPAAVIAAPGEGMVLASDQALRLAWWWIEEAGALHLINTTGEPATIALHFTVTAYGEAAGLDVYLEDGAPVPASFVEGSENRVAVGPLTLPPGRLFDQFRPKMVTLVLVLPGAGEGGVGIRDFEVRME
ncbi:MAG: hypothetical protein JXB35_09270, partial [Anaerolineae bacterium]|nr:hypothetical protein [Anaerolineae bacterium]